MTSPAPLSETPLFDVGRTTATPGVLDLLSAHYDRPAFVTLALSRYITRHVLGDWAQMDDHDRRANARDAEQGNRVLSAYTHPCGKSDSCGAGDHRLWVVTFPGHETTTVLLPSEY